MIRLAVRCRPEQAEIVLAELAVLAPHGVEESQAGSAGEPLVEYAIYGGPGEVPQLGELEAVIGGELVEVQSESVADDWAERWRDFHRPVLVANRIWVRPPWSEPDGGGGTEPILDLVIDPGQAFGTGAHPTTRLCLELLVGLGAEVDRDGQDAGALTDLGAGSGVLAIAARKLGYGPVTAYDHDPAAIAAIGENATANRVEVRAEQADLRAALPPLAAVTVANLMAPLLIELAPMIQPRNLPEVLICSGILPDQADSVCAAFAAVGLNERDRVADAGWCALKLGRER